ncbi:MAG: PfkB family carbohydrate kinase [Candidatus Acidiferrales bacterium]
MSASRSHRKSPAASQGASPDLSRLLDLVSAFPKQTIALAGDLVLDQFVSGEISRVSREAPVLILRRRQTHSVPGGGANALINLSDLGARVLPIGAVGDDASGRTLLELFRKKHIDVSGIATIRGWTTPTKTRYLAGWTHTSEQQVLRVDDEPQAPVPPPVQKSLTAKLRDRGRRANAVLVSDYGFGAAAPSIVKSIGNGKPATLDSRYALLDFRGADLSAATPNESELEAAYGARIGRDAQKLEELGRRALEDLRLHALLVTRGRDGMALFEENQPTRLISIHGSDEAADVTGAGDTVIAVFTLALAASATYLEAAHLANFAGGIVVMKRGTATVTRRELEDAVRSAATTAR